MTRIPFGTLGLAVWAVAAVAQAQIEITWTLANNRTVLMEPVRATVFIANHSGRLLDLTPRGNARLTFDVEDQPTSTVPDTGQPLLRQAVVIPAGETRGVDVNLLDAYRIVKGQSYMLTPMLEFDGIRFAGQRLSLEVQPGIELLKRSYGVLSSGDAREVSLRLIHRARSDELFFRIDNSSTGFCLGVYDIGQVIRFFVPRLEQDGAGDFHVLHQASPDRFAHSTFDYDGAPQGVVFYSAQAGVIQLVRTETDDVEVQGGTPFLEDAAAPGLLVAPALPPSHPYNTALGEPIVQEPSAPVQSKPVSREKPAPKTKKETGRQPVAKEQPTPKPKSENSRAGSEPVSW